MSVTQWLIVLASIFIAHATTTMVFVSPDMWTRVLYVGIWAALGAALAMAVGDEY